MNSASNNTSAPQPIPFINLIKEHAPFQKELEEAALRVIRSGRYLHGPETGALEKSLSNYLLIKHAIGCSNGLDALRLIFRALIELKRFKPGDGVIVPANTFIASVLPITEFRLTPILVEPDSLSHGLNFSEADKLINNNSNIRAVLLVHLYGLPSWNHDLCNKWADSGITIIEDNAQALGATIDNHGLGLSNKTGALAHVSATSFYPTKNIGALGDAGFVATNDDILASTIKTLANYGSEKRYHNILQGYNCRIDEIQAAMLRVKLQHIDSINDARRKTADIYNNIITNPEITKPVVPHNTTPVWHQYPILTNRRDELMNYLSRHGIATDIHYPVPPHKQPCYRNLNHTPLPITENLARSILSLPIQAISESDAKRIADAINKFR